MIALLKRTSIRVQMLVAMLIVGIVTLVVVTLQSLHCAHEGVMDMQRETFRLILAQQREHIDSWVESRASILQLIASSPILRDALRQPTASPRLDDYLREVEGPESHLEEVALYNLSGELVASSGGDREARLAPVLLAQLGESIGVAWHLAPYGHRHDDMTVVASSPILGEGGDAAGYLLAMIHVDKAVSDLEERASPGSTMKSYLVNLESGRRLGAVEGGHDHGAVAGALPITAMQEREGLLFHYLDEEKTPVIGMGAMLPRFGWLLVVEMAESEAFAMLRFLLHRAAMSGAGVILLIVLLALGSAKLLGKPLQTMTATCRRVANGSMEQRLGDQPGQEANHLAEAFNTMLDRLQETQRQLVQAGALAAVGELSASVVHEMRNPVNTIQMNLEAMRRKLEDEPKLAELHLLAQRQTLRLQSMLNNLLTFSKPLELRIEEQELRGVVEDALEVCRGMATESGVSIKPHLPESPVVAAVDREQVFRVLINLVENAIHVQPGGGAVEITLSGHLGQAVLEVEDRGPGIPEEMREKIFRPFFTTRADGTGLGLAIVKKIVELHHGSIELSDAGERGGSTFIVRLPRHKGGSV